MTKKSNFSLDGDHYDIRPEAALMLLAHELYGDKDAEPTKARARLKAVLDVFFNAAHAGGFHQCDILETLLFKNELSLRVHDLVEAAVSAAGDDAADRLFAALHEE